MFFSNDSPIITIEKPYATMLLQMELLHVVNIFVYSFADCLNVLFKVIIECLFNHLDVKYLPAVLDLRCL